MPLNITDDREADSLLNSDPFALLVGMLLDQQVAMETAFAGPHKLAKRLGSFTPEGIAAADPQELAAVFAEKPAIHRYPGSMAGRTQKLAETIVEEYKGDTAALWEEGEPNGHTVLKRLKALPGFGDQKARIFLALLGKQHGFTGEGWREASAPYGDPDSYRSVADITGPESLVKVREYKREAKSRAKSS